MIKRFGLTVILASFAIAGCETAGDTGESDEAVDSGEAAVEGAPAKEDGPKARKRGPAKDADGKGPRGDRGPGMFHGHRGGGGGPEMLLHAALREDIGLSDAQRTAIEEALGASRPGRDKDAAPKPDDQKQALATAIRSGSIDVSAFAKGRDHEADHAARRAKSLEAIKTLHATLDADQRAELVKILSERLASMPEPPKMDEMPRGKGPDAKGRPSPAGFFLRDIDLHDGQREAIDAALEKAGLAGEPMKPPTAEEMKAHHAERLAAEKALLDAFAKSSFDTSKLPEPKKPEMRGPKEGKMVETLAVVVPLLDEDQREALAVQIESERRGHGGGPGMGRRGRR